MTIFSRFRRNPRAALIAALHRRIAEAARDPALYARLGVADTVEGRFACLTLHVVLVLRQLRRLPARDDARLAAVLAEHFDTAPEALPRTLLRPRPRLRRVRWRLSCTTDRVCPRPPPSRKRISDDARIGWSALPPGIRAASPAGGPRGRRRSD